MMNIFESLIEISQELGEAKAKDIVKGLSDADGPFTVVAIRNNKVIRQETTKMRDMLPAIVKTMRKDIGPGGTIGIEDRKGTIRNTFKEEVELDEATRTAFKGGDKATADFQRKLKEMGMAQEYMKMVRLLKKKGSGFGLFMKEEDRGEEYASRTGIGPSLGFSIEKVNGEKLGSEDVQKRGDTTYKKTLVAMNESVMTESINPKDIDPTGYYSFYSNSSRNIYNITGPYSSEKEAYRDGRGDLDNILTGTELIKRLKKGEYKKWSLHIRESVELDEAVGDVEITYPSSGPAEVFASSMTRKGVKGIVVKGKKVIFNIRDFNKATNIKQPLSHFLDSAKSNGATVKGIGFTLDEVSPPGWEGTVKAMKKKKGDEKISNPWALAWWMKGKGYKSHYDKDGNKKK